MSAPLPGLDGLAPMPLAEVNERARLVSRICRTYLVPVELVPVVFAGAAASFGVLTIGGRNSFRYSSTYMDTPDLRTFHDHRRRRRRRFKVRVRSYADTGARMCEVKTKDGRGGTDKTRIDHTGPQDLLVPESRAFVERTLRRYGLEPPGDLLPGTVTDYHRTTLVALDGGERVTLDTGLVGIRGDRTVRMRPDVVLVEVKTHGGRTPTERRLHEFGVRATGFSKYTALTAALEPGLPGNRWHRSMRYCLDRAPDVAAPRVTTPSGPGAPAAPGPRVTVGVSRETSTHPG
ncbi:VTC domain-containing protein [Nocardiopsis sp. LOL_012]|uniref:VTC domain-containing protein n=1 Tax=Nocardiopsis sp. LOL_012 TaxID=3345409 RepID=UPI003A86A8B8